MAYFLMFCYNQFRVIAMDIFVPDIYQKSIYTIDYGKLKKRGIKCILFDLDNTLVPYTEDVPYSDLKNLFLRLEDDYKFKVIIMSNSGKKRLTPFKEQLNVDVAYSSMKPLKFKYKKIMRIYNYKPSQVAAIGDQLITDMLGANRFGITTILVNPIGEYEPLRTKVNRFMERKIINRLNKKGVLEKGKYYD